MAQGFGLGLGLLKETHGIEALGGWGSGSGSADLGGRVGWLPKAERVKTLFLSPYSPKTRGGVGGGGGRGGIPASFPSRSPPPKQPFQPTPTPSPGSHQEVCEKIVI